MRRKGRAQKRRRQPHAPLVVLLPLLARGDAAGAATCAPGDGTAVLGIVQPLPKAFDEQDAQQRQRRPHPNQCAFQPLQQQQSNARVVHLLLRGGGWGQSNPLEDFPEFPEDFEYSNGGGEEQEDDAEDPHEVLRFARGDDEGLGADGDSGSAAEWESETTALRSRPDRGERGGERRSSSREQPRRGWGAGKRDSNRARNNGEGDYSTTAIERRGRKRGKSRKNRRGILKNSGGSGRSGSSTLIKSALSVALNALAGGLVVKLLDSSKGEGTSERPAKGEEEEGGGWEAQQKRMEDLEEQLKTQEVERERVSALFEEAKSSRVTELEQYKEYNEALQAEVSELLADKQRLELQLRRVEEEGGGGTPGAAAPAAQRAADMARKEAEAKVMQMREEHGLEVDRLLAALDEQQQLVIQQQRQQQQQQKKKKGGGASKQDEARIRAEERAAVEVEISQRYEDILADRDENLTELRSQVSELKGEVERLRKEQQAVEREQQTVVQERDAFMTQIREEMQTALAQEKVRLQAQMEQRVEGLREALRRKLENRTGSSRDDADKQK